MLETITQSVLHLAQLTLLFGLLSLVVHRRCFLSKARSARSETITNLIFFFTDSWFLAPALVLLMGATATYVGAFDLIWSGHGWIGSLPIWLQLLLGIVVSDFVGYWRHRLLHTAALWPVHSVHHSDPRMTWLTLLRFHPINRLVTTMVSFLALLLLGFPGWVIAVNGFVRSLYGHFIHADIPLHYGPLGRVFVSPVMHRWHHAKDIKAGNRNFATIFALFDTVFGTYHVPGKDVGELGVLDRNYPADWIGQILHPLLVYGQAAIGTARRIVARA